MLALGLVRRPTRNTNATPPLRRQGTLTGGGTTTSHDVLGPPAISDGLGFRLEEEM